MKFFLELTITQENVQSLLSAANLLEMLNVRDACCQVIFYRNNNFIKIIKKRGKTHL